MGALGTDLTIATKIVVTKLKDKELYEIIYVYGNNEDFDCICLPFSCMPIRYKKETLCHYLQIFNTKNLPVYTCEISHNINVMTREEGIDIILNTTELWDINK